MISKIKSLKYKDKRLLTNMVWSVLLKGSGVLISLLLLPSYMRVLDNNQVLGVWFTILSILSWFVTFDLGIGNGLRNKLVEAINERDQLKINQYVSSAYLSLGGLILIVLALCSPVISWINWGQFFDTDAIDNSTLTIVVLIVFLSILLQFFLKLIFSVLYAFQKPTLINLATLISNLLLLIGLNLMPVKDLGSNMVTISLIYCVSYNVLLVFLTVYVFKKYLGGTFPKVKYYQKVYIKSILSVGGLFFIVQVLYLILSNTNELLISQITSSKDVVEYKIYYSIFSAVNMFFMVVMVPVWSEITEAYVKRDFQWLRSLNAKLYKFFAIAVIGLIVIACSSQLIINLWLGKNAIEVNYLYLLIFVFYSTMFMWNNIISCFSNGMGLLKIQVVGMAFGVIVFLVFAIFMTRFYNDWIFIILANILALLPYCIWQTFYNKKILKNEIVK